jgi:hypothetical protein
MTLPESLRRFIPMRWRQTKKGDPLSMVLLLRAPHLFSEEELRRAAERAWHITFTSEAKESMHCVVQSGKVTMMKAGPHGLNFFYYALPYVENPSANVAWLPQEAQREAWLQHSACFGVDYLNEGVSVQLGYCVLAQLVSEMLDGNCTAVYIPQEQALFPNNESLYLELYKLASACNSGVHTKS